MTRKGNIEASLTEGTEVHREFFGEIKNQKNSVNLCELCESVRVWVNGQSKCAFGRVNAPEARLVCLKQGIAKGDSGVWRLRGRFWPSGAPKKGVKECGAA